MAYGFYLAIAIFLGTQIAPQPAGSIVIWAFFTAQLAWGSSLVWRRTRLPFATAALVVASATSALITGLALSGTVFPHLSLVWWIPVAIGLVTPGILFLVESRVNREKWTQWKEFTEHKTAWDVFTGRHIPDLGSTRERG